MSSELMHATFPMKTYYRIPTGFIPTGYVPMNQTCTEGKNPQGLNPIQILGKSLVTTKKLKFHFLCGCNKFVLKN